MANRLLPFMALVLLGCTEYAYTSRTQVDVFQQVPRNTVDILLIVDNSGSMSEEQDKLASNFDSFIKYFDGIDVDWRIGVITTDTIQEAHQGRLQGGDDEIELSCGGISIDRVAWTRDWDAETGVAMQLDPSVDTATGNDSATVWCAATEVYGTTDRGSPGAPNAACSRSPQALADTGGGDTGGASGTEPATSTGQVLITEFMADPADVTDDIGEWFEVASFSSVDLDLSGCTLHDDARNAFVIPDGTVIPAGGRLVFGRSAEGVAADVLVGSSITLNNDLLILTPETEGPAEIFAELVAVGYNGSGLEMGLEAAHMALSEPRLTDDNESFLREEAALSMIFVSDENDISPYPVDDYIRFLTDLKGEEAYRDHSLLRMSSVVGKDAPEITGGYSCTSDGGSAEYGSRYVKVAERTEGVLESICEEDFSPIADRLGLTLSGLDVEFALSESCDENTLVVTLYADATNESLIGVLTKDLDYTYEVEHNSIRFVDEQVPEAETYITAEYRVMASGASNQAARGVAQ